MGNFRRWWGQLLPHAPVLVGLALAAGLLVYRLGSLPVPGLLSGVEVTASEHSESFQQLVERPLYLPLTGLQYVLLRVAPLHDVSALRLASVLWAILAIAAALFIVRRWYGSRILLFATAMTITAAGFLHYGRLATFDVLYLLALPLLIASHILLSHTPLRRWAIAGWLLTLGFLCYIPGMVWFVILQAVWQRQAAREGFMALKGAWWRQSALVAGAVLGLVPLICGFVRNLNHDYILTWFGLPTEIPAFMDVLKNAAGGGLFIFTSTPADPARWLGRVPLLGAFMLICFVAGVLFYLRHLKAERTQLLASITGIAFVLLAAGGPVSRPLLIPLVYLIAFGGLAYILHYWLKLFPLNPFARRLGIGLVTIAVALVCMYNLRHYYVAWPHNSDVRAAFDKPFTRP
jgi:hypothetical protein